MSEHSNKKSVSFSIDPGLIQRLGYELVRKRETAIAELIKNAYDADAKSVKVSFFNSEHKGGKLEIFDTGSGMNEEALTNGFLRISSTSKVREPFSEIYHRKRAGQKGIGRFAAQRLGNQLTITTKTIGERLAHKVTIDWCLFEDHSVDLTSIEFPMEDCVVDFDKGTLLEINDLKDIWNKKDIESIGTFLSDLFQPNYLSENSILRSENDEFEMNIINHSGEKLEIVPQVINIPLDKSLATIEGYLYEGNQGYALLSSNSLSISEEEKRILYNTENESSLGKLNIIARFKINYFIYDRPEYYSNISKEELLNVKILSKKYSGVKIYRNGFRVGVPLDDWIEIERRNSSSSGMMIPFSNKNLYGFVEIIDINGILFEETASREGLIVNEGFNQLQSFVNMSLNAAKNRISLALSEFKEGLKVDIDKETKTISNGLQNINSKIVELSTNPTLSETKRLSIYNELKYIVSTINESNKQIIAGVDNLLQEKELMRLLASLGLATGEFIHEMKPFPPLLAKLISEIKSNPQLSIDTLTRLDELDRTFQRFFSYTRYFGTLVSQNMSRAKSPINVHKTIKYFIDTMKNDASKYGILLELNVNYYGLFTIPMHQSELLSILMNLYTNARKAIVRNNSEGKISISIDSIDNDIVISFQDNGIGIIEANSSKIFLPFYSTSKPAGFDNQDDELSGTGLGLFIVKEILSNYSGTIALQEPQESYKTNFVITIPKN